MICPIMSNRINNVDDNFVKCCEEECAWYNKFDNACAIQILSNSAINVAEVACGQRTIYTREV